VLVDPAFWIRVAGDRPAQKPRWLVECLRSGRACQHRPANFLHPGGMVGERGHPDWRGGISGQCPAVSGQQLRCHHPHRRAVLTAGQALRAESLQRLLRSGGRIGSTASLSRRRPAAGSGPPAPGRGHAQRPPTAARCRLFHDISELDVTPPSPPPARPGWPIANRMLRSSPGWNRPARSRSDKPTGTACWPPSTPGCCAAPSSSPEQEQGRRRREVCTTQSPRRWRNRLHDRQPTATAQTVIPAKSALSLGGE
jgi:hypothetical protein